MEIKDVQELVEQVKMHSFMGMTRREEITNRLKAEYRKQGYRVVKLVESTHYLYPYEKNLIDPTKPIESKGNETIIPNVLQRTTRGNLVIQCFKDPNSYGGNVYYEITKNGKPIKADLHEIMQPSYFAKPKAEYTKAPYRTYKIENIIYLKCGSYEYR